MSLELLNSYRIQGKNKTNIISFTAAKNNETIVTNRLPKIEVPTPKDQEPVKLPGVPRELAIKIIEAANNTGVSVADYLSVYLRHLATKVKGVVPEPSVTANVGRTKVTTLIDAKQIFDKTIEFIKSAEKNIQIEMFEMQNLKVDADLWPSGGAEVVPGWSQQQQILDMLIKKKQTNPNMNIQVILDVHKWYQDGFGNYKRHFANMKMIEKLKENNIDVVPYPRPMQGGTVLQHVKFLAVDSKKVLLGGMNWGNHSAANHDACVAIETLPKFKSSEVDNIIEEIFHKDWKFSWQRLAKTKFVPGPVTPDEQDQYKGRAKEIKDENVEYMKIVGKIFDKPEYKNRYNAENLSSLNLPQISPVNKPAIQVLVNRPREYSHISELGDESIGKYIKDRLDTCSSLKAELFVLSHKEIVNKIITRYMEAQKGGRPFDCEILISPGILDDFPYCRKAFHSLEEAGVPIRVFNVNKALQQRLHTKWAVFDNQDLIIGSANWSAVGLENNVATGQRQDYPLTNKLLDARIAEYKVKTDEYEKEVGLKSLYKEDSTIDYVALKERMKAIKADFSKIEVNDMDDITTVDINKLVIFKKLLGYYNLIKIHEERKENYKRGNHECAVVIPNKKIASVFLKQFQKDWEYSTPIVPDGYGAADSSTDVERSVELLEAYAEDMALAEGRAEVSFSGKQHRNFIKAKEPMFNKVV